jgi:hypothetical protein
MNALGAGKVSMAVMRRGGKAGRREFQRAFLMERLFTFSLNSVANWGKVPYTVK